MPSVDAAPRSVEISLAANTLSTSVDVNRDVVNEQLTLLRPGERKAIGRNTSYDLMAVEGCGRPKAMAT